MVFKLFYVFVFGCAGTYCCLATFLIAVSGGYSLVAGHGLLIAVAFLVAENKL